MFGPSDATIVSHSPQARIAALDGWRGISILLVLGVHLINWRYSQRGASAQAYALAAVVADVAVDIFFVVSGFVITHRALAELRSAHGFHRTAFYFRRLFRIVPPFLVYLCFVAALERTGRIETTRVLPAALFICNAPGVSCDWFVAHSWTLAYEEQFYLVFPWILWLGWKIRRAVFLPLALALVLLPFARFGLGLGEFWRLAAFFAQPFVFLCAGAALAEHQAKAQSFFLQHRNRHLAPITAAALVVVVWLLSKEHGPVGALGYLQALIRVTCLPLCLAALLAHSLYLPSALQRCLEIRWLQYVGRISYSLYIWQQLFTGHPSRYLMNGWLLFTPLLFLCALGSHYGIERPFARLAKRWFAAHLTGPAVQGRQT